MTLLPRHPSLTTRRDALPRDFPRRFVPLRTVRQLIVPSRGAPQRRATQRVQSAEDLTQLRPASPRYAPQRHAANRHAQRRVATQRPASRRSASQLIASFSLSPKTFSVARRITAQRCVAQCSAACSSARSRLASLRAVTFRIAQQRFVTQRLRFAPQRIMALCIVTQRRATQSSVLPRIATTSASSTSFPRHAPHCTAPFLAVRLRSAWRRRVASRSAPQRNVITASTAILFIDSRTHAAQRLAPLRLARPCVMQRRAATRRGASQ
jgi:hypothetical protein